MERESKTERHGNPCSLIQGSNIGNMHRCCIILICFNFIMMSCCLQTENDVVLSPFCQALIESYSDQYYSFYQKEPGALFLDIKERGEYFYLYVWGDESNNPRDYPFVFHKYLGTASVDNKPVFVNGPKSSLFYSASGYHHWSGKEDLCEYDPIEWKVAIRKSDTTYCLMKSGINTPSINVSILDSVALCYFDQSSMTGEEIYQGGELDDFPKIASEVPLEQLKSRFCFKEPLPQGKHITINILVDKTGRATILEFEERSGTKSYDEEAMKIARDICNYTFVPARIRGEYVNAIYSLCFWDTGWF